MYTFDSIPYGPEVKCAVHVAMPNTAHKPVQGTEARFVSFLSGRSIIAIVVNPPKRKPAKRTFVQEVPHAKSLMRSPTSTVLAYVHESASHLREFCVTLFFQVPKSV